MNRIIIVLFVVLSVTFGYGQKPTADVLPYAEIPEAPESYTAGTVVARMLDGLGFRFYWATEGLRDEDLKFKPSEEGRSTGETIDHIYGLSKVIVNATLKQPNNRTDEPELSFAEQRKRILNNIKTAADIMRTAEDLSEYKLIFIRGENTSEFPFWNNINGPIADALWHCGQVVTHRRTSGNPFNSKVSVFNGRLRN